MAEPAPRRTYALLGAGASGKTSLAEMLLFQTKTIDRLGKTEEGTTTLDFEPEEIKRRGGVQPGFARMAVGKQTHFLVDVPGDTNFNADLPLILKAVDSAVLVVDAVDGVRPLSRKLWKSAKDEGLPGMIVVNKLDRDLADFAKTFDGLKNLPGAKPVLLNLPIMDGAKFVGLVDLFAEKAHYFDDKGATREAEIPAALVDEAKFHKEHAVENIAESDETLMEKYLEEGELSEAEMLEGLKKGAVAGLLTPVLCAAALENKGAGAILTAISELAPAPNERAPYTGEDGYTRPSDEAQAPAAFVFKTLFDPFAGQLSIVRVLSGLFTADTAYKNMSNGEMERVGQILHLVGKNQTPVKDAQGPGAVFAVAKFKAVKTGDTLCDPKAPFKLAAPKLSPTLITYALAPKEKGEEDKVYQAVHKLLDEDVTLALTRDEETADILLSGMGQLHIETAVEKARRRYKVDIELKPPRIPYRETIKGRAEVQGRHKKQTGGRGQFGDCWVRFEPKPRGEGYEYVDAIVGGVVPRQFIPAVDKGIQESAKRGFLAGYPMVDFKATIYDGSYHTVDSSEMAFKTAGSLAFKKAMETCKPILLEPIVLVTVSTPDEYMGDVIGDLSSRRGKVLGSDSEGGVTEIKAHAPMAEVLRYAPDLRSMTAGQGSFIMEFDHYEEAPPPVAEKVVAEYKKDKGQE